MWDRLRVGALSDAFANPSYALVAGAFLMGWDSGNSQWERIKISAAGSIMTKEETSVPVSSGPITTSRLLYSGSADAFAVTVNKDAVAAVVVQLIDGSGPGDPVKWEVRVAGLEPFVKQFRPWLLFPNGLYINIVGSPYSVIVEYGG